MFVTCAVCTDSAWVEDMGRQESPQLIERKTQIDTDAQKQVEQPSIIAYQGQNNCCALEKQTEIN